MSENDVHPRHSGARCTYAWCTTRHGLTVHPDDETHRSSGSGFTARVRGSDESGAGRESEVEVGILRRPGDVENWLAIELGSVGLALSIDGARELRRVLAEDPQIREALSS
ncbi:hypothetical protein AB0870_03000 [Microbacterium proteolyticum]|uniref:hypothetical protein n=1 Tax=Microbacterium TaxID=33882 RepID=UPI002417EF5A|nr:MULTISPECIES: hypothetical protein [Microbacterium]MBQ9916697.1 hypothetical protein [Microbacterium sp.]MDI9891840.1 hypothetical protein [Microbacterium sp. IEGM 1404]